MISNMILAHALFYAQVREIRLNLDKKAEKRAKYERPDLESWTEKKCKYMFRFTYNEICRICEALKLDRLLQFNDLKVERELAMAILLYRYSFPRKLGDMTPIFGMSEDNIGRTINKLSDLLMDKIKYGLEFDETHFSKKNCKRFSEAIFDAGSFFPHIVGFINDDAHQGCGPKNEDAQNTVHNVQGHTQCNKFHTVITPDGIINIFCGPYANNNERSILSESQFQTRIEAHFKNVSPEEEYVIYGGEAHWSHMYRIQSYREPFTNDLEKATNESVSKARAVIEMNLRRVSQYFCACEWKYGNVANRTKLGTKYAISIVLKNFYTCINKSVTPSRIELAPPTLEEYIDGLMRSRSSNDIVQ